MFSYVLRPTGLGASSLKLITIEPGVPFIIGRNPNTFGDENAPKSVNVSRKLAVLEIDEEGELTISPCSRGACTLYINESLCSRATSDSSTASGDNSNNNNSNSAAGAGQGSGGASGSPEMKYVVDPGDVISMLGSENYFNFVVSKNKGAKRPRLTGSASSNSLSDTVAAAGTASSSKAPRTDSGDATAADQPASTGAAAATPQSPGAIAAAALASGFEERERSLECSICMDMIACAHSINNCDCGRPYCYSCISAVSSCPSCRKNYTPMTHLSAQRFVDDTARTLLKEIDSVAARIGSGSACGQERTTETRLAEWERRCNIGLMLKKLMQDKTKGSHGKQKMSAVAQAQASLNANMALRRQQEQAAQREADAAAARARANAIAALGANSLNSARSSASITDMPSLAGALPSHARARVAALLRVRQDQAPAAAVAPSTAAARRTTTEIISIDDNPSSSSSSSASNSNRTNRTVPRAPASGTAPAPVAASPDFIDLTL